MELAGNNRAMAEATHGAREALLRRWLDGCRGILYRVLMVYAESPAEREDLEQEIALALWRSTERFEGASSDSTWVYRVALNTALTHRRVASRTLATDELTQDPRAPDPERDEQAWLYAAIRSLSPVERSLVLLWLDGTRYEDIALILGISTSLVGVKISRVKARLRAMAEVPVGAAPAQPNQRGNRK